MITVAVLAVLATLVYPSYIDHVRRGHRTAAQGFMLKIAVRQEQYMLDKRAYTGILGADGLGLEPPPETVGRYTFGVDAGTTPPGYTITAVAIGSQSPDGNLTLDHSGYRAPPSKWQ